MIQVANPVQQRANKKQKVVVVSDEDREDEHDHKEDTGRDLNDGDEDDEKAGPSRPRKAATSKVIVRTALLAQ